MGQDILMVAGLLVGCLALIILPILGAMWVEGRRAHAAQQRFAAALEGAAQHEVQGPGAWKLTALTGRRAGCDVSLAPRPLDSRLAANSTLRHMGMRLSIRGTRDVGRGTLRVERGALVTSGTLAPIDDARRAALIRCKVWLDLDGSEAHVDYPLPLKPRDLREMLAMIDAIGPYLSDSRRAQDS